MRVIAVSLSRALFDTKSADHMRMCRYAEKLEALHIIVLTRKKHGIFNDMHFGNLHIYPTQAHTFLGMIVSGFIRTFTISRRCKNNETVITAQDPLEIGLMCFCIGKLLGIHFHVQVHGDYWSTDAWLQNTYLRRIRRSIALKLLKRANAIRVVSFRIYNSLLQRGISKDVLSVLPIRTELERFLDVHRTYDVSKSTCTFLFTGRFAPEKDILRIIRSFKIIYTKFPHARLRIVGDGTLKVEILKEIERCALTGAVEISPWTHDVPRLMSEADVFVLASKHEAYGLVLIEAMASGLPVISTEVGCVGEVVEHEKHGLIVFGDGELPYAQAMEAFIVNPSLKEKYGREGRATALQISAQGEDKYIDEWIRSVALAMGRV